MNVVLSLIVGLLIGLADFLHSPQRGAPTSLLFGIIGGGIGMQLASVATGVPGIDDVPDVFSLVMADASMIESR